MGSVQKCFLCGGEASWMMDYDFAYFGYDGKGIVHRYRCVKCGTIHDVYEEIEEAPKQVDDRQITWDEVERND